MSAREILAAMRRDGLKPPAPLVAEARAEELGEGEVNKPMTHFSDGTPVPMLIGWVTPSGFKRLEEMTADELRDAVRELAREREEARAREYERDKGLREAFRRRRE